MSSVRRLHTIVDFLDRTLRNAEFDDASHNGLQVANTGRIGRVCCGVDASQAFFDEAARRDADLLICHHGISWNTSLARITDLNYDRVSTLIRHDMALYASHLPLDAHPKHGNNVAIARALGLTRLTPFGHYRGKQIGFEGVLPKAVRRSTFFRRVEKVVGQPVRVMEFGPAMVKRVAVVSGGASGDIEEAGLKGLDAYVTGEPTLAAYHLAQEHAIHGIFAGHYATERFGVRALGDLLAQRFGLQVEFIDFDIPY